MTEFSRIRIRRQTSGFSLLEIGLVIVLVGILLLLGFSAIQSAPPRLETQGASKALKSWLGEASSLARARNVPVAIGLPKTGTPTELVLLYGDQKPRLERRLNLESEFPGVTILPGTTEVQEIPDLYLSKTNALSEGWNEAIQSMNLLVFLPSGEVLGEGVPLWENRYHFLVTAGADVSGTTVRRVAYPQTVSVGLMGDVQRQAGAGVAFGTPEEVSGALTLASRSETADLSIPEDPPVLSEIVLLPDPNRLTLPANIDAKVDPKGYLTLIAKATSPNGIPLVCRWQSRSGGQLTAASSTLMTFDDGQWVAEWHWRAPDTPDLVYKLECFVEDINGIKAENGVNALVDVEVANAKQRLLFGVDGRFGPGTIELFSIFEDGSGEQRLHEPPPGKRDAVGGWSPDGSRLALTSNREGGDELFVMNADGSDLRKITSTGLGPGNPEWSPTGTRIAFSTSAVRDVWVVGADGSNIKNLSRRARINPPHVSNVTFSKQTGGGYLNTIWSPDEEWITFTANPGGAFVVKSDGSADPIEIDGSLNASRYAWHPDSDTLALVSSGQLYITSVSGGGEPTLVPCDKRVSNFVQFSPDGQRLLFCSSGNVQMLDRAAGTCTPLTSSGSDICASWLDDETISFVRRTPNRDVYIAHLSGGGVDRVQNVTDHPLDDNFYGWTPDLSGGP
jgi:Tol biopolymer transport system component